MKNHTISFFLSFLLLIVSCSSDEDEPIPDNKETEEEKRPTNLQEYNNTTDGLKDYYTADTYFEIGAAIESSSLDKAEEVDLMKRHFSSLTAENVMKWSSLQRSEGNFNFTSADKIVDFAQANGMKVRGHTLCWYNQTPDWVFKDGDNTASKELVLERLRTHISTVMKHFKGKVYAWDVVNEAIDDGSGTYRASKWFVICGSDFIIEAFKAAREADTEAKLFYNDYSTVSPTKREKIFKLLKRLNDQNLIDGVGMQSHWNIGYPSDELVIEAFDKYTSLGLEIHITELDVSVYTADSDPESAYTTDIAQKQVAAYSDFFSLFRRYKDHVSSVTFWGLADNHTWLDNFPVRGRKNYPFLFDTDYNPKEAYFSVIEKLGS